MKTNRVLVGDAREMLRTLPDECAQCCVTSPPYWGLRDYGVGEQLGRERDPAQYVASLVGVLSEVRRVLARDGVLWLNIGDTYSQRASGKLKSKELAGVPWMAAFALRDAGWFLRSDVIWAKPNPMPESVTDRPTRAHEYVFMLTRERSYFYDQDAVREAFAGSEAALRRMKKPGNTRGGKDYLHNSGRNDGGSKTRNGYGFRTDPTKGRNRRTVWTIAPQGFAGAHFATMPPRLAEICIRAASRPGDVVIDPFFGAGTTGVVAKRLGRRWIGCELNDRYARLAEQRITEERAP